MFFDRSEGHINKVNGKIHNEQIWKKKFRWYDLITPVISSEKTKPLWEYLNILDFLGATQAESLTVFRDLFHDPSSGAQPKCTTAVWWGKILMKMTMALNCPIFTITATSMSSIMGRSPIVKENSNCDTLLWFTRYSILRPNESDQPDQIFLLWGHKQPKWTLYLILRS